MNIEDSIKTLTATINAKFAAEGCQFTVKARRVKGFIKLSCYIGTITFIDDNGRMTWGGNVTVEADRAALVSKVFRGR